MIEMIMEFIILLVAHASAGLYSCSLKYSKRTTNLIWGIWIVIQIGLLIYTELALTQWTLQFLTGFVIPFVGQYIIFFATTKGKPAYRVFTILTYSIFFCIGMSLFTMLKGTYVQLHPIFAILIHAGILFGVVTYFLRFVCPLCRIAAKNIASGWGPLIFVDIVFVITLILSAVFPVRLTSFHDPAAFTFIFISISILAVYPVIFSNLNSMSEVAEKREMERLNKLLLAQIDAENAQHAAESQARHDRRHHNLVMMEYVNNNDIESLRTYLENLVENENTIMGRKNYCNNPTINTVLSVYEKRAKVNGIAVKISANVTADIEVRPQDMVIIIANLFENAIHAAEKLQQRDRYIKISIKESAHRLLIKVKNSCKDNQNFDETHYGVGIHSLIATTNKYDGMYDFSVDDGVFTALISLNL